MNKANTLIKITVAIISLFTYSASAQFTITQQSAANLVQNVLVGQGVQVSNITSGGDPEQIGLFTGGNSVNLGISNGVLMTTGNAVSQSDPNGLYYIGAPASNGTISSSFDNTIELTDDPDLNAIITSFGASGITNNIAAIEFDFIPSGDSVAFNYVFASEEYNAFVCSQYFDVFGFFISGPGITGPYTNNAANIAIVPGTNLPVSMNTINDGISDGGNLCPPGGLNNTAYYVDNSGSQNFGPYGFTDILTAQATVQCGQTYHIKLVLANGFDNGFDSWVFLQAESFTSNIPNIDIANLLPDSAVVEGCTEGNIVFRREIATDTLIVPINFAGNATPIVDYSGLPDTLVFLPGVDSLLFTLIPVDDGISEGVNGYEEIIISFELVNDCGLPVTISKTIKIRDPYVLEFVSSDTTLICPTNNVTISSLATGGYGPYSYSWDYNNLTTSSITVPSPTDSATYILTVRDILNCYDIPFYDTLNVIMGYDSLQTVTSDSSVCPGTPILLSANYEFGAAPYTFNWPDLGVTTDTVTVIPTQNTSYVFQVTDQCNVTSQDTINIIAPGYVSLGVENLLPDNAIVENCTQALVTFIRYETVSTLNIPITYSGSASGNDYQGLPTSITFIPGIDSLGFIVTPTNDGNTEGANGYEDVQIEYSLLTDCGETINVSGSFQIRDPYVLNILANDVTLVCPAESLTVSSSVSNGYPPYSYSWSFNNLITPSIQVPAPVNSSNYTVTIQDSLFCNNTSFSEELTVTMAYDSLQTFTQDTIICLGDTISIFPSISLGQTPYTYNWEGNFTTESISVHPTDTTTYTIEVKDFCDVSSIDSFIVYVPRYDTLFVNVLDTTICENTEAQLAANAIGGNGTYSFEWFGDSDILEITQLLVSVRPDSSQNFICIATDGCGVMAYDTVRVEIEKCDLLAGNSFSPNGDGKNDYFEVENILAYPENKLTIFNRWGKLIFETNAYKNDWSGGDDITSGTYFYIIENVTDPKKPENNFMKGTFTVFK
jgi:gliding motility-associated-like protein